MPNAFVQALSIEEKGKAFHLDFLKSNRNYLWHQYMGENAGEVGRAVQWKGMDILVGLRSLQNVCVEFKTESARRHPNFFLETWSNRATGRPGWFETATAKWIFYLFLDVRTLYVLNLEDLRRWANGPHYGGIRQIERFPEKEQKKFRQDNDTWGRCVRIDVIGEKVGYHSHEFISKGVWRETTPPGFGIPPGKRDF